MKASATFRGEVPAWARAANGYGYGYGYGSGYGHGSGDGSGYGSGDGSGDGYGYGYGYGDGDGSGEDTTYWPSVLEQAPGARDALGRGASTIGFWRSDKDGRPCNGGRGTVARVGLTEEIAGPLQICTAKALHATVDPTKWKGERLWVVALWGEVQSQEDKLGALKREFIAEITPGAET